MEFLRAVGAKDLREMTQPDYTASHKRLRGITGRRRGKLLPFHMDDPGEPTVAVHFTEFGPPEASEDADAHESDVEIAQCGSIRKTHTAFTIGLSDRDLKLPDGSGLICTELRLTLPADWPLTEQSIKDPRWNWPMRWMLKLAREAMTSGQWPAFRASVFMNGDPPQPLTEGTKLCGWLVLLHPSDTEQMPDYRFIDWRDMFPIYADEQTLILSQGHVALLQRFGELGIAMHIGNLLRPSGARKD